LMARQTACRSYSEEQKLEPCVVETGRRHCMMRLTCGIRCQSRSNHRAAYGVPGDPGHAISLKAAWLGAPTTEFPELQPPVISQLHSKRLFFAFILTGRRLSIGFTKWGATTKGAVRVRGPSMPQQRRATTAPDCHCVNTAHQKSERRCPSTD
jgi:hypothetical protein